MGMGIVSSDEFDLEIDKFKKIDSCESSINISDCPTKGRGEGSVEVPDSLRKIIGETAITDGRQSALELAKSFGISSSSVSAYTQGAHSTKSYNQKPNLAHIERAKERITKRARGKLLLALSHITEDKLSEAKLTELASVATAMSKVATDHSPESGNGSGVNVQFNVFRPRIKEEDDYQVIHVTD